MIVAIAPTEREALDIGRRAMDGLVRRTEAVHENDRLIMSPEDCEKAIAPLRGSSRTPSRPLRQVRAPPSRSPSASPRCSSRG